MTTALANFPMLREQAGRWKTRLAEAEWTPWLIIGLAAFLRLLLLGMKPPHFDEGINGWFVDAHIIKDGFYKYDPTNYHGPLHFYVLFLSETLFGRSLWALRMPVVLLSVFCVWLTLRFEPLVGRTISRMAALAMAVSPGFVFYGRYSIHEVWLVLFSMLFILGLLRLWKFGTPKDLWCAGMGLTGMILTKETYSIHVACAAIAVGVCYVSHRLTPVPDAKRVKQTWDYVDLAVVLCTGIALIVFFYSGTFFHWDGLKGLYRAYAAWVTTGQEGHGHEKPWYYWLRLMARYEQPAALGLIFCLFCQRLKNISLRYLAIYGVGTLAAYSIVPYKTPWCIISFIWPFLFLLGAAGVSAPIKYPRTTYVAVAVIVGASLLLVIGYSSWRNTDYLWAITFIVGLAALLAAMRYRETIYALFTILICVSLGLSIRLNYFRCTTDTEPYVYVQTYNDIYKLTRPMLTLAKRDPIFYHLVGHMIRPSSYPIPWMLGEFPNIGYYEHENMPAKMDADVLLVQEAKIKEVEEKLRDAYYTQPLTVRPYQEPSKLYFSAKKFKEFFPDRDPDIAGKGPG